MTTWEQIKQKVVTKEEAEKIVSSWKKEHKKVVFTNGCFDVLHRGHVTYLAKASSIGDKLVVGINDDSSVKRQNKGEERPVNDQESRALIVASLSAVDLVVIFSEDTPIALIQTLQPSFLVKGADYDPKIIDENDPKYIVGSKEVRDAGGEVATIDLEEGFSTTNIIKKLKNQR